MAKIDILGVQVDPVTLDEVLAYIEQVVADDRRALIVHTHVMGLNLASAALVSPVFELRRSGLL